METVAATQARLEAFILDYCAQSSVNVSVDLSPGSVLSELLIKLSAELHNQLKNDAETPSTINSVQAALSATGDTYSEAIDAIASNYNVVREQGTLVTGTVKVIVAYERTYYINDNFQLVAPSIGATYVSGKAYRIDSSLSDSPSSGELKLYTGSGTVPYYFLLPVTALSADVNVSAPHNISLALNPANTSLDGFIEARAYGNFASGKAIETDRELIARFQVGLACKGLMSPQSIQALLPETFPGLFTQGAGHNAVVSVVGAADSELLRGKNITYGITPFGLADVYVRTSKTVEIGSFLAQAVYNAEYDVWRVTINSGCPGFPNWFYDIISVSYTDSSDSTQIAYPGAVTYSVDSLLSPTANQLDGGLVSAAAIARFTKYQACTFSLYLTGIDNPTDGQGITVSVMVSYMPQIGEIQDYMLQSTNRVVAADYLVKAMIPCSISMKILAQRASSNTVDTSLIKQDIFNYINELAFNDPIVVSKIIDICHNYDISRVKMPLTINGSISLPTTGVSTAYPLVATDTMFIPKEGSLLDYGVSNKTTMFFIDYEDANGRDMIEINLS